MFWLALATATALAFGGAVVAAAPDHAVPADAADHGALDDEHLRHLIHFILDRVDEPQRTQVGALAHAASSDLEALAERAAVARAPRAGLLLADRIDAQALERVRRDEMRVADERSQRVDRLLVDLATALTPEQRARLREEIAH
jgi:Spy/CpxP family protein refolding chaperone